MQIKNKMSVDDVSMNVMVTALGGKYIKALKEINLRLRTDSNNISYLQTKAEIYYHMRRFKKSIKMLKLIIKLEPVNLQARYILSENYLALQDFKKLILNERKIFKNLSIIRSREKYKYYISLANALRLNHKKNSAIQILKKGLADCKNGKNELKFELNETLKMS